MIFTDKGWPERALTNCSGRPGEGAEQPGYDRGATAGFTNHLRSTYPLVDENIWEDEDINELRRLQDEMDRAVLAAYGWDDLDPDDSEKIVQRLNVERDAEEALAEKVWDRILDDKFWTAKERKEVKALREGLETAAFYSGDWHTLDVGAADFMAQVLERLRAQAAQSDEAAEGGETA